MIVSFFQCGQKEKKNQKVTPSDWNHSATSVARYFFHQIKNIFFLNFFHALPHFFFIGNSLSLKLPIPVRQFVSRQAIIAALVDDGVKCFPGKQVPTFRCGDDDDVPAYTQLCSIMMVAKRMQRCCCFPHFDGQRHDFAQKQAMKAFEKAKTLQQEQTKGKY